MSGAVREQTWSPSVLAPIYLKGFSLNALDIASEVGGGYGGARTWLRKISFDSIRKNPRIYTKFVASMAYMYYVDNIRWRADFVNYLNGRSLMLLTSDGRAEQRRRPIAGDMLDRYFAPSPSLRFMAQDACARGGAPMIEPTTARRVYRAVQRARDLVFSRTVFVVLAAASLLASLWRLAITRGRHDVAFAVFLLGIGVIGSGMVVSLVEYAGHRYSYPTEFGVYVVVGVAAVGRPRSAHEPVNRRHTASKSADGHRRLPPGDQQRRRAVPSHCAAAARARRGAGPDHVGRSVACPGTTPSTASR